MEELKTSFDYEEFTTRNIGFINRDQQNKLKDACVFVCGVGGMGGACLQALARGGVGRFIIADMDVFEVSNLNRQVFADLSTVNVEKTKATEEGIARINPQARVEVYGSNWLESLGTILDEADIVVNGMDDVAATIQLYRACRNQGRTLIDAYASSLPSVYVTKPGDPMPEERLGYPTKDRPSDSWSDEDLSTCFLRELEHVMACSSSRKYIDMQAGAEMASGERSRMSFAPMVILTGNLMAYEAINALLGLKSGADCRGYFFNPYTGRTERPPPPPLDALMRRIARRVIARLMNG